MSDDYPKVEEEQNRDTVNLDYPTMSVMESGLPHTFIAADNLDKYTPITLAEMQEFADPNPEIPYDANLFGININIIQSVSKGSGIQKYTTYYIKGEDKSGQFEIYRRYSEFDALRDALLVRWPGIFIPNIPTKQVIGKNDTQVTLNRTRFLNDFLKKIANITYLYYGEQFQIFLKSTEPDVSKILSQYKRESYPELLKKYTQAFPEYLKPMDIFESQAQISRFESFLKENRMRINDCRKMARALAESRQKYDEKMASVFEKILPEYEANSILQFTGGDETTTVYKRLAEYPELSCTEVKQVRQKNAYWLVYDLIKFEEREMEALAEAFKGLQSITHRREDAINDIRNNEEEIENMTLGKKTIRSVLTKGTNEEIIAKLKAENEQLEKLKELLQEIQNIVTEYLYRRVIHDFKVTRQNFLNKVVKKTFSFELYCLQFEKGYYEGMRDVTGKILEQKKQQYF